jgi:ferredoxin
MYRLTLMLITAAERCSGHARCNALAPELFELDERGYTALPPRLAVPADLEDAARMGADSCPERVFELRVVPSHEGER